jgi:hypothetical protein
MIDVAHTLVRITSTWPPASITAVSPRNCTTFPSIRTMRCWKFERCGARMRGVCGWSIASIYQSFNAEEVIKFFPASLDEEDGWVGWLCELGRDIGWR